MRWLLTPALALFWLISSGAAVRAAEPEIWFLPITRPDWRTLLSDTGPWQDVANNVSVIGIPTWWLQSAPDSDILLVFNFAQTNHIKLNMEVATIIRIPNAACGQNDEGYSYLTDIAAQVAVLNRLHLHFDILTMDEPIWNGTYDPGPNSCHFAIPDLVGQVAPIINMFAAQNPDFQLVEIETIPAETSFPDWRQSFSGFRAGLAQQTGKLIRDIQADTGWDSPGWQQPLRDLQIFAHQQNMGLGFYMYGGSYPTSSAQWISQAVQHMDAAEGMLGIIPEQAIFASWSTFPLTDLPETSPTTLTWLIHHYLLDRTRIVAQFVGQGVQGRLTSTEGKPIPNAVVNAYVPGVDFTQPLPVTVTPGVVPPNAAYGLIGYRLNVECGCTGENDILIGTEVYQETQGGSQSYSWANIAHGVYSGSIYDSEWVGGVQVSRVITNPSVFVAGNSAFFSVTPNAQFNFTVPASTIGGDGWYGHAMVLFFDQNKNSVAGPLFVIPDPGRRLMSTATTAADGSFALPSLPRVGPEAAPVTVEFPGDDQHRAVTWSPLQ
jgi:hypothetical protein